MTGKVILASKYFVYKIYENGSATKTSTSEYKTEKPLNRYEDMNGVYVWVGRTKSYVKALVAKYFMTDVYKRGCVLHHIDGDRENCALSNLLCVKRDFGNDSKIYTKVELDGVEYDSIAAAERALGVSHGYLTKYFKGQIAGKIVEEHKVRLVDK